MAKKWHIFILIFLLVIGAWLRMSGTWRGFFAFTFDQGRDFLQLHDIVNNRNVILIGPTTGIDGVFHGVWWYYFLAIPFWFVRGNPTILVLFFNLFSLTTILAGYVLGEKIRSRHFGLVLAGIISISPFWVGTSAQLWHPHVEPLLVLLLLYVVWLRLQKKIHFAWIAFLLGAIFEFEFGFGGLFVPASFLALLLLRQGPHIKEILLSVIGFTFWFIPRLLFEFRNEFIQTKSFIHYVTDGSKLGSGTSFFVRLFDRLSTFWEQYVSGFFFGNLVVAIFFGVGIIIIIFNTLVLSKNKTSWQKLIFYILLTLGLFLFFSALYPNVLWGYYLVGIPALYIPLVGIIFLILIEKNKWLGGLFFAAWFVWLWQPLKSGAVWEGDAAVFKNQIAVVEAIYEEAEGKPFNVSVYSPSVIDYNYQYLFLWHSKNKFGYMPNREKNEEVVFFVIEPDPWNKGLREIWIRERIGDGETLFQREFPGGIILEKRIRKLVYLN